MISSPFENQISKRISFPDVRPKVTHESFSYSNTWSGSTLYYYQDFVLSEQFDLNTTLITADHMGDNSPASPEEGFEFEVIDDAGGTIVRLWYRYNDKVEPGAFLVRIVQGLSYVAYEDWSAGASAGGAYSDETLTIATIPNWDATGTAVESLWSGAKSIYGQAGSGSMITALFNLRTTDASTLAFTWYSGNTATQIHSFVVWRA